MDKISKALSQYFNDEIDFPKNLDDKGVIDDRKTGWYIRYILSKLENGETCLDFTADHRMTNPRHVRINSEGELQYLEMYQEGYTYDSKIPGDEEIQLQKYYEHNRNVSRILIRKGLMDLKGNEVLFDQQTDASGNSELSLLIDKINESNKSVLDIKTGEGQRPWWKRLWS